MAALRKRTRSQVMDEEDETIKKEFTDFFRFCSFVLAYEEQMGSDTLPNLGGTYFSSAVDGVGSAGGSTRHSSSSDSENDTKEDKDASEDEVDDDNDNNDDDGDNDDDDSESSKELLEYTSEDESWHLVTCFCGRPFAGRPMIECSKCLTWIHLFCARIKKQNVPDVYVCQICKDKETRKLKRQK